MIRRLLFLCCALLTLCGASSLYVAPAHAQITEGLQAIGDTIKLPSTDPRVIAARIINVALGLIGLILVTLLIYAGFLYMTSGGEAAKIEKALGIIRNAVIGLIIILSAWAITTYVINALLQATQEGGGLGGSGGSGLGGGLGGGSGTQSFQIKSITPQGSVPIRNVQVKILFNKPVDEATVGVITVSKDGVTPVPGTVSVTGATALFTPSEDCPAPNTNKKCFDADSSFTVKVGNTVKSSTGQALTCGGFAQPCQATFHTGNVVDAQVPAVSISFPTDGMSVPVNFFQDVLAEANDDSGVATVEFFDGSTSIGLDAPIASTTPMQFSAKQSWNTASVALGVHSLSAIASDIDTNTTKSADRSVVVRPEICFQQPPVPGVTCSDPQGLCGACTGGSCTSNADCNGSFCLNGVCVAKPVVSSVSPSPFSGAPGSFVTLKGLNFGSGNGTVTFLGDPNTPTDDRVAQAPAACVAAGISTWSNTQVIVAVPDGTASGPVQILNSASGLSDRTDQDPGPKLADFQATNELHPGLCGLAPSQGHVTDETDAIGVGFGASPSTVKFGDLILSSFSSWTDGKIRIKVPIANSGPYQVAIKVGTQLSNEVTYTVLDKTVGAAPIIDYIDPIDGPQQEYITVSGKNFGFAVGNVIFIHDASQKIANGDDTFPPECSAQYWRDDHIVIKVPEKFTTNDDTALGTYQLKIKRPDGAESNSVSFTLKTGTPKPGICAISPPIGPASTAVKLIGDHLGPNKPVVTFSSLKQALVNAPYTNVLVTSVVPAGAVTGPVTLAQGALISNKVNFQVKNCNESPDICGPTKSFQCCPTGECRLVGEACGAASLTAEYAWQTSTGLLPTAPTVVEECAADFSVVPTPPPTPSPSPWIKRSGGNQASIDADVVMRFSRSLVTPMKRAYFRVLKCVDAGVDPCVKTEDKTDDFDDPVLVPENATQDTVTLSHTGALKFEPNTTYLVNVSTEIKSSGPGGTNMEVMTSCGKGPNGETYGYCFQFKTRNSTDPSVVGSVGVVPNVFSMHIAGQEQLYKSTPIDAGDKCIVLNCKKYDWKWFTGTEQTSDSRASLTNDDKNLDGYVDCVQTGTGLMETNPAPVDMNAKLAGTSLIGTGQLMINFIPPSVEAFSPNCDQACSNALIWARFTEKLDTKSVETPGTVEVHKCFNENCYETDPSPLIAVVVTLDAVDGRTVEISPQQTLEPGAFYRVLLKGGPTVDGIKGLNGVPITQLNHPLGYQWMFRVKVGQDAFCVAERVDMSPTEKRETSVQGRQLFSATPYSKPDVCSANGQQLVSTGASWVSTHPDVADLYRIPNIPSGSLIDTSGQLPSGCAGNCLATGAAGQFGKVAVCGNGVIETTDGNFCKAGFTPTAKACTVMQPGAKAGEECEPGLDGLDLCDSQTCLYRPIPAYGVGGGSCGDGVVDRNKGEACDFGPTCVGGSHPTSTSPITPPVAEFTPCTDAGVQAACIKAGGTCGMHNYRGCSSSCRHLGAQAGKTTCGISDPLGDGKDCDDGNTTVGDGCSAACLHEGSVPTTKLSAVCGNENLEPGETCERSKVTHQFAAGCDQQRCVHTGTIFCSGGVTHCCGNAKLELGEDCDDGNYVSDDGCSASCLFEGSNAYYQSAGGALTPSFCGNGKLEQGEQCEAGVNSAALANTIAYVGDVNASLPSSAVQAAYTALTPAGQKGGGKIDRVQLAFIQPTALPDPNTGIASTTLVVTLEGKDGMASYGVQCGYTSESSCAAGNGLDDYGCCRARPSADKKYPEPLTQGVCRNVQLSADFNVGMLTDTVTGHFEISQPPETINGALACPTGTHDILVQAEFGPGIWNWFKKIWHSTIAWWSGLPAQAELWCAGLVTGQLLPTSSDKTPSGFAFTLDRVLDAQTWYLVRFIGDDSLTDNNILANKHGVKTAYGVVQQSDVGTTGALVWKFKTGDKICTVNNIKVTDQDPEHHPYLFLNSGNTPETRNFKAEALSVQNGQPVPLSSIANVYDWTWDKWSSSKIDSVDVSIDNGQTAAFTSKQVNGNAILTATLVVSKDTVNVPTTEQTTVAGIAPVTVQVCENPWPSLTMSPLRDVKNSVNFAMSDQFYGKPPYNFETMYCMDAGKPADQSDDLPALAITQVPHTTLDDSNGILRQYLFVYGSDHPELKQDGIGIRILMNPEHLSPMEWYIARGFTGKPQETMVDGYPAIKDGTTIYVAAANRPNGNQGNIYSNIYLISHNPNAGQTTLSIYNQMVRNLAFNINPEFTDQSNTCTFASPKLVNGKLTTKLLDANGKVVACTADWECVKSDADAFCDSMKAKLTRDSLRIADFQSVSKKLDQSKDAQGRYPQASAGTYLRGMSVSPWPSWTAELGSAVGEKMPKDPVNRFLTCGRCVTTQEACSSNADCPQQNGVAQTCVGGKFENNAWVAVTGTDPLTCWNSISREFTCPRVGTLPTGVSRFYQYLSQNGGLQYRLAAEYEVPPPDMNAPSQNWWSPALPDGVYRCVTPATLGQLCGNATGDGPDNDRCLPCANPNNCKQCALGGNRCVDNSGCTLKPNDTCTPIKDLFPIYKQDACRKFAGSYKYTDICGAGGSVFGEGGVCGDGVQNATELCELGMTQYASCTVPGVKVCSLSTSKVCTTNADCLPSSGVCVPQQGHRLQSCVECTKYADDLAHPSCVADAMCGNGRIDKRCSMSWNACLTVADCPIANDSCLPFETCDDGLLNGGYGHCNTQCSGISGYCGDGQISPGEICDEGAANGDYNGVCSLDCKDIGPHCGDLSVNGPEQCDGNADATESKLCSVGKIGQLCAQNSECNDGAIVGVCGGGLPVISYDNGVSIGPYDGCAGVLKTVGGIQRKTQHVRACVAPGTVKQCLWQGAFAGWTACQPVGICGDGVKDTGEACDDGANNGDTKACTSQCTKNMCGDGKVYSGVEDCDMAEQNGKTTCSADYNSSCLACSALCKWQASAGGYCGDTIKNGAEQCDGLQGTFGLTCQGLGFDYATKHASVTFSNVPPLESNLNDQNVLVQTCRIAAVSALPEPSGAAKAAWAYYNTVNVWNGQHLLPLKTKNGDSITEADIEYAVQTGDYLSACKGMAVDYGPDIVGCTNSCLIGNCARCADTPGNGKITGRVWDALFQQVVPNARVTLMSKGVKVDQVYTDGNGVFNFSTVNINNACNSYRLVVDMYEDNVCTGTSTNAGVGCYAGYASPWEYPFALNEGDLGGYFPFTSNVFSYNGFAAAMNSTDGDGVAHVDIYPRPNRGTAYAAVLWNSTAISQTSYKLHVVLPKAAAYSLSNIQTKCDYDNDTGCARDINWRSTGSFDLSRLPYTSLICLHRAGEKTAGWANPAANGCPMEGVTQCKLNYIEAHTNVSQAQAEADAKVACADDAQHSCALESKLNDCGNPARFGPLAAIVNYAPLGLSNDQVSFYFIGASSKTNISSTINNAAKDFHAYIVFSSLAGNSQILSLQNPPGSGWAWHLGDVQPKADKVVGVNQIKGSMTAVQTIVDDPSAAGAVKPIEGLGVWDHWFQGAGRADYCMKDGSTVTLLKTNPTCFGSGETNACEAVAGYSCGFTANPDKKWDSGLYYKFNW